MNKHTSTAISEIFIQLAIALFVFVALSGLAVAQVKLASIQSTSAVNSELNHLIMNAKVKALAFETVQLDEALFLSNSARAVRELTKASEFSQAPSIDGLSLPRLGVDYKVNRRTAHMYANQSEYGNATNEQAWQFLSVKIQSEDVALKIGNTY
jgi:hypothetical protein